MRVRFLTILVLTSLIFSAVTAVVVLLFGEFNDTTGKILGSSATIAGYSLLAMAGAAAFRAESSQVMRTVGAVAAAFSALGCVALLLIIWLKMMQEKEMVQTLGITTVTAGALALIVLLDRITLLPGWRWMYATTVTLIILLALLINGPVILLEMESENLARLGGVVGILASLGILSLPIAGWQASRSGKKGRQHLTCPHCGKDIDVR